MAYSVVRLFGFTHDIALGYFSIGCAPGGGHSNIYTFLFNGDVSLSVTMTFVSNIASLGEIICTHRHHNSSTAHVRLQDVYNDTALQRTKSTVHTIASLVVLIVVSDILSTMCVIVAGVLSGVLVFVAVFLSVFKAALGSNRECVDIRTYWTNVVIARSRTVRIGTCMHVRFAIFSVNTHRHTNHLRQMRCSYVIICVIWTILQGKLRTDLLPEQLAAACRYFQRKYVDIVMSSDKCDTLV